MPATAVYDLVSFDHQNLSRKHFGARSGTMLAARPQQHKSAPKIVYNSCSDSEDETIYESLEQINLRKERENKHRQAKISKVQRTGHPLFDHLREERALKENVKKPVKSAEQRTAEFNNTIRNMKMHLDPKSMKKHKKNSENLNQSFNPKYMSLQQLEIPDKNRFTRKLSEQQISQTLPKQLNVSKKALAKSEQNLMNLHPNFMNRPHNYQFMNPMSLKRQVPPKVSNKNFFVDSSDSESDWIIPRPKFSQMKAGRNRSSDESDFYGNPIR